MSEAVFFEETPDLAKCEKETVFYVWDFLEPSGHPRCDSYLLLEPLFALPSFSTLEIDSLDFQEGLQRFPTWVFTEVCALKVVLLDGELFEGSFGNL